MTNPDEYQGWANRETWCVRLWLSNDAGLYAGAMEACNTDGEMLPEAAQTLSDYVDELLDDQVPAGFTRDMVNCCLARVNWTEVAQSFREE